MAARERPKKALDWLKRFCAKQKRLLIGQVMDEWIAFGPAALPEEIFRKNLAPRRAVER